MIHAGPAANAAQRLLDFASQNASATGIDQDEVHVLGAVEFTFALHPREDVDIIGNRLAGGRARKQAHECGHVFERRHHFFDSRNCHVHLGQRRGQGRVAFVGHQHHGAGFGDEEIAAGNSHVGAEIVAAEYLARFEAQIADLALARRSVLRGEELRDLGFVLVQCRTDDVRGRFVIVDLQDVFAEVGLDDRQSGALQRMIEGRLLAHHRLGFDDLVAAVAAGNIDDVPIDVGGRVGP